MDPWARKDYSHRKAWLLERLALLDRVFPIDVCAYAVMSSHYHLVLHVQAARARGWTEAEVIERWQQLFRLPRLVERHRRGQCTALTEEEAARPDRHLARRANREDCCTGRFWEGRFKSQALLDEAGLLTALAYVDLNPVRAGIALTPERSPFTSIAERIRALQPSTLTERSSDRPLCLLPFRDAQNSPAAVLPFTLTDYLTLLDWTGRAIRQDRRGRIAQSLPPVLTRLHIEALA